MSKYPTLIEVLAVVIVFVIIGIGIWKVVGSPNWRAKTFGGSMTYALPAGEKFVNATWKEGDLWYITRKAKPGETTETYIFQEKSSLGVLQGTVTFVETPVVNKPER
jgi:hypothetical protein